MDTTSWCGQVVNHTMCASPGVLPRAHHPRAHAHTPCMTSNPGPTASWCLSPVFSPPQSFFAERFFTLFDSDGSGTITLQELLEALTLLIHGNPMDKLKFLFQVYDVDGKDSGGVLFLIFPGMPYSS